MPHSLFPRRLKTRPTLHHTQTPLFFALTIFYVFWAMSCPKNTPHYYHKKAGGGEDVDFCLKVSEASNGGKLIAVPEACVVHPFWDGSIFDLSRHFFNWAVGDGALFTRHPRYKYWSYPNMPETVFLLLLTFIVLLPFILIWTGPEMIFLLFQAGPWMMVLKMISLFFLADVLVDFMTEYKDRCMTLLGRGDDNNNNSNNNPTNLF